MIYFWAYPPEPLLGTMGVGAHKRLWRTSINHFAYLLYRRAV